MSREWRNILNYVVLGFGAFIIASITAMIPQLLDPNLGELDYRIILAAGLSAFVSVAGSALYPRVGSAELAHQVDKLRGSRGLSRKRMKVVPGTPATAATPPTPPTP